MSAELFTGFGNDAHLQEEFRLLDVQLMHERILRETGVLAHAKNVLAAKRAATYDESVFEELEAHGFEGENELTRVSIVTIPEDNPFATDEDEQERYPETVGIRVSNYIPGFRNGLGGWFHEYVTVYTTDIDESDMTNPNFDTADHRHYLVVKALAEGLDEDWAVEYLPNLKADRVGIADPILNATTIRNQG